MRLSLKTIWEELLGHYPGVTFRDSNVQSLEAVDLYRRTNKKLLENVLYVDVNGDYPNQQQDHAALVLFDTKRDVLSQNVIFVPTIYNLIEVFSTISALFRRFQKWEMSILDSIAKKHTLTDILNLCRLVTPDTVYLTDPSLKMLGYTTPTLMESISSIWRYQINHGYMPMYIIDQLTESGELEILNKQTRAFTTPDTCFNLPYTCKNIFSHKILQAHIFIISIYSKPKQRHMDIVEALGQMLPAYLDSHPDTLSSLGTFHECFFRDILKGELKDSNSISEQLRYFNWKINDDFILIIIKQKNDSPIERRFLSSHLESDPQLACKVFDYEEYLIAICHSVNKYKLRENVRHYAARYSFHAAISKEFHPLNTMAAYYEQTKLILSIGQDMKTNTKVYLNDDYGLYSLIAVLLEKRSMPEICHDGVLRLYESDQKNGTDYIHTLFVCLCNDRNALQTSKALFIHRNTLLNRLEKIFKIVDINQYSTHIRHYILFSLYIINCCDLLIG